MKQLIISISIFFISLTLYSDSKAQAGFYSGEHDSLLFDGSVPASYDNISRCTVKVERVTGNVQATVLDTNILDICGQKDTMVVLEKRKVKVGDILVLGDEFETGPGGQLGLDLPDGTTAIFGPNTKAMIFSNYCEVPSGLKFFFGHMWINIKKQLGKNKYEVKTERACMCVRGTEFTVETKVDGSDTITIVKVHEGSVSFEQNANAYNQYGMDKSEQIKQLNEDYMSGKISMEEYAKKMKEIQQGIDETAPAGVIVNAGYESRAVGSNKPTDPVPFDKNDNRWWEEK